jgi:hypothetical protein
MQYTGVEPVFRMLVNSDINLPQRYLVRAAQTPASAPAARIHTILGRRRAACRLRINPPWRRRSGLWVLFMLDKVRKIDHSLAVSRSVRPLLYARVSDVCARQPILNVSDHDRGVQPLLLKLVICPVADDPARSLLLPLVRIVDASVFCRASGAASVACRPGTPASGDGECIQ